MDPSLHCVGARIGAIRSYGSGTFVRYRFEGWRRGGIVLATSGEISLFDWPWAQQYVLHTSEGRGEVRRIVACIFGRRQLMILDSALAKSRPLRRAQAVEDLWLHMLALCQSDKAMQQRLLPFAGFLRRTP